MVACRDAACLANLELPCKGYRLGQGLRFDFEKWAASDMFSWLSYLLTLLNGIGILSEGYDLKMHGDDILFVHQALLHFLSILKVERKSK